MANLQATQASDNLFASLGLSAKDNQQTPQNDASALGLDTFLKLMVTQMNNQDPFKPMENGDFLGQIAQFGSVTGLDKLNRQIEDLGVSLTSGQALQAGGLVGRDVLVPVEIGRLQPGQTIRGQVELPASSSEVTLRVYDDVGQLIRELPMGSAGEGPLEFAWDGFTDAGAYAPPGLYQLKVSAAQGDGSTDLNTELFAAVESVSLQGANGLTLNLQGLGPVSFNNVKQIY